MRPTRLVLAAAATLAILAVTPALTADQALECVPPPVTNDFMQIHMDNQKIGSPVHLYWKLQTAAWRAAS